jgi:hypothetical protein
VAVQAASGIWLDKPLAPWNVAGAALPKPPARSATGNDTIESREALVKRCDLKVDRASPEARAIADAGWVPFLHFDQELKQGDVTILDGMAGADGMCRPLNFQVFVFVAGRFAGTLSPAPMSSRLDGAANVVRLRQADAITAEFQRYTSTDALCCPSSRVTVSYAVDRSGKTPIVKPLEVRTTRQF